MAKWTMKDHEEGHLLVKDQESVADVFYRGDAEEIARKMNSFDDLVKALREYQDHSNWHWNGEAWEWNGGGSGSFKGDPTEGNGYPSQDAVDAECGALAKSALVNAEGRDS